MKQEIVKSLGFTRIKKTELNDLIEIPKDSKMGDYAFPCFLLAKKLNKSPIDVAKDIASKVELGEGLKRVEAAGGYVNFFVDKAVMARDVIGRISKEKWKYGSNDIGRGKGVIVEMSSPNIAKPFGIGHLRSTIIGNSISNISKFNGYKVKKINYLGDWGTQFGKLIVGYKLAGKGKGLEKKPLEEMLKFYVEGNKEEHEDEAREWFNKLEQGEKEAVGYWKLFRRMSMEEFDRVYKKLGIRFDVISGESEYNKKMKAVVSSLDKKGFLKESEGAQIVDLGGKLGISLIKKKDGATLYITRDLAAAIDRQKKYKFSKMIYEVGSEQKLHFNQLFKILGMLGYRWAKDCVHVDHGLYLDKDGKKLSTRKGKTVFMESVLDETIKLAKKEIGKREKIKGKELDERARKIAIAAIFYGDLKNYRSHNSVFDIERFLSFEGDTGPYLLYSYVRSQSILKKAKKQSKVKTGEVNEFEGKLVTELGKFPEIVEKSWEHLSPNLIANYAYELCRIFNEFYHNCPVIGSDEEAFRLRLVESFGQVIKNALGLLGIEVIERM
jgi:arginyl-tRNA synthetase